MPLETTLHKSDLLWQKPIPENFLEHLRSETHIAAESNIKIPSKFCERAQAVIDNPVAVVTEYISLLYNVLTILVGVDLENMSCLRAKNVRTSYYKQKHKGLFGHALAAYGITEAQKRNTLHFHILVYGSLSPEVLQKVAQHQKLTEAVSDTMESMYKAEFPRHIHVQQLL